MLNIAAKHIYFIRLTLISIVSNIIKNKITKVEYRKIYLLFLQ